LFINITGTSMVAVQCIANGWRPAVQRIIDKTTKNQVGKREISHQTCLSFKFFECIPQDPDIIRFRDLRGNAILSIHQLGTELCRWVICLLDGSQGFSVVCNSIEYRRANFTMISLPVWSEISVSAIYRWRSSCTLGWRPQIRNWILPRLSCRSKFEIYGNLYSSCSSLVGVRMKRAASPSMPTNRSNAPSKAA